MTEFIKLLEKKYQNFYSAPNGGLMSFVGGDVPFLEERWKNVLPKMMETPTLDKTDWSNEKSILEYAKAALNNFKLEIEVRSILNDDKLPTISASTGTGSIGATYVKDPIVHQEANTNYLIPPIKSWDDGIDSIGFDPENMYYKAQMTCLKYYVEHWDGMFSILPFSHFDPLDLANQLRGNDVFYDLYEEPEKLHQLLEKCTQSIIDLEEYTWNNYMKGYGMKAGCFDSWMPKGSFLSCDAGDLISAELLEEFGIPYTKRIIDLWGGAYLHHHELGAHQIASWAKCDSLTLQFVNRDFNTIHLAKTLNEDVIKSSLKVPIVFVALFDEFKQNIEKWAQGKFVVVVECSSEKEAYETVNLTNQFRVKG